MRKHYDFDHKVAYAYTEFEVEEDTEGFLGFRSDDGFAAWLDGEMILKNDVYRPLNHDPDTVEVNLKKR